MDDEAVKIIMTTLADIRAVNQNGDIVAVARHILRWVKDAS